MKHHFSARRRLGAIVNLANKALPRVLLALALAAPIAAYPIDLPELLRMPLEQLLQLKLTALANSNGGRR